VIDADATRHQMSFGNLLSLTDGGTISESITHTHPLRCYSSGPVTFRLPVEGGSSNATLVDTLVVAVVPNKKVVLSQGKRAMPQLLFLV